MKRPVLFSACRGPAGTTRWPLVVLLLGLTVGCVPLPQPRVPPEAAPREMPPASDQATPAAEVTRPPVDTRDSRLIAAEAALERGDRVSAQSWLDAIEDRSLSAGDLQWMQLIQARIAAAEGRPNAVLQRLPLATLDPVLGAATEALRAEALRALGDFVGAIRALVERDRWLDDTAARDDNRAQLWRTVQEAPLTPSDLDRARTMGRAVEGWVALGLVARQPTDAALQQWRAQHPQHSATAQYEALRRDPQAGSGLSQLPLPPGGQWAVLLPFSGPLAAVAEAIRDGWVSAYLAAGANVPVQFFDTGGTPEGASLAFERALASGAVMVIGPLRRESVDSIAARGMLPVPVIALNQLDGAQSVPNLYQFALAPEDEARAAADHAVGQGLRTAVTLLPDSDWGARVEAAFAERLESLGGRVLARRRYAAGTDDHSTDIKALMQIEESEARHRQVSAILGERPVFQARRRADVDFVFFAGRPTDGRLIWSQFRFHRAHDLPAYATAMVYSPDTRPGADLAGSRFCDMPIMLDPRFDAGVAATAARVEIASRGQQPRLFAMGLDAFSLAASVARGQAGLGYSVPGTTGELWFDVSGAVQRRLDCARFTRDGITVLPRAVDPGRVPVVDETLILEDGNASW